MILEKLESGLIKLPTLSKSKNKTNKTIQMKVNRIEITKMMTILIKHLKKGKSSKAITRITTIIIIKVVIRMANLEKMNNTHKFNNSNGNKMIIHYKY